jgi:hypothetical protein
LSSTTRILMAAFSSANEKKRWLRSRARIHRWATCTATSTFALSFGRRAQQPAGHVAPA